MFAKVVRPTTCGKAIKSDSDVASECGILDGIPLSILSGVVVFILAHLCIGFYVTPSEKDEENSKGKLAKYVIPAALSSLTIASVLWVSGRLGLAKHHNIDSAGSQARFIFRPQ